MTFFLRLIDNLVLVFVQLIPRCEDQELKGCRIASITDFPKIPTAAVTSPQEKVLGRSVAALRCTHLLFITVSLKCTANLSTILSYLSLEEAKLAPFSGSSIVPEPCTP